MFVLSIITLTLASTQVLAAENARHAEVESPKHPWYVKYASSQIVDFCFLGGMFGGLGGGYSTIGGNSPVGLSTVSFSSLFTETVNFSTATTLFTTIPGSVVTIYGSAGVPESTSSVDPTTLTSVLTPTTTGSGSTPALITPPSASLSASSAHGLFGFIEDIEHYAHALAEAIIAPAEMTALLSSAADDLLEHGFIHATKAKAYVTQASSAFEALRTDPAYSAQSANLAAQPTPINFPKAFAEVKETHSAGIARFLAEPEGHSVGAQLRDLASKFLDTFGH